MKLRSGDMLIIVDHWNNALKLQIIGRDDVPRVEKEGRGWSDGATVLLKGADVAEFMEALESTYGEYEIGDIVLSVKFEYDDTLGSDSVVLSAKGVSVRLTWPERTLLMYAVRGLAWKMFM